MASMVLLGKDGNVQERIGSVASLPPGYKVPDGCCLSWKYQLTKAPASKTKLALFTHGKAKIFLKPVIDSVVIHIESPVAKDLLEAIELIILYMDGKVASFETTSNTNSFVFGVINDCKWIWQSACNAYRRLRQRIGFRIAK